MSETSKIRALPNQYAPQRTTAPPSKPTSECADPAIRRQTNALALTLTTSRYRRRPSSSAERGSSPPTGTRTSTGTGGRPHQAEATVDGRISRDPNRRIDVIARITGRTDPKAPPRGLLECDHWAVRTRAKPDAWTRPDDTQANSGSRPKGRSAIRQTAGVRRVRPGE